MQLVCFTFAVKVSGRLWNYEKCQNIEVWKGLGRVIRKGLWYTYGTIKKASKNGQVQKALMAAFCWYWGASVWVPHLEWRLGARVYSHAIFRFSLYFINSYDQKSCIDRELVRQLVHKVLCRRYLVSFYLWRMEQALKLSKTPKYYAQDCS